MLYNFQNNLGMSKTPSVSMKTTALKVKKLLTIDPIEKENLAKMFNDPKEYLTLPNKIGKRYIIGREVTGPKYDEDDKVIPYSVVGRDKGMYKKNKLNQNITKTTTSIMKTAARLNVDILGSQNKTVIDEKELKNIFVRSKNRIEFNKKEKNSIYSLNSFLNTIPTSSSNNSTIKALKLQEKNLKNYVKNEKVEKILADKIAKTINKITINNENEIQNKKLLMTSIENYRTNKIARDFNGNNEYQLKKYGLRNYWALTLRKTKDYKGILENCINIGNNRHPVYCKIRESFPHIPESVINPMHSLYINNKINNRSLDKYVKMSHNSLSSHVDKLNNLIDLEVKGEDLLEAEKENAKLMKGRKKVLYYMKFINEFTKDLDIASNWGKKDTVKY